MPDRLGLGCAGLQHCLRSADCRQTTLELNFPHRGSKGPLHLLFDSTGIKVEGEGEWNERKHGGAKRRRRCKIDFGIDDETLEIKAVEVTSSDDGNAPMLLELLDQSFPARRSPASLTTEPVAHVSVTIPLRNEVLPLSFHSAGMRNPGKPSLQAQSRTTRH